VIIVIAEIFVNKLFGNKIIYRIR
jgi:hypothetical protein